MTLLKITFPFIFLLLISRNVNAHEHHELLNNAGATDDPIDGILWAHIVFMSLAFGVIFPTGMVLGLSRSSWHVPFQTVGAILALFGYFLGHAHEGRQFSGDNIHSSFSAIVVITLASQILLGIYLKLHLEKGFNKHFRPPVVILHKFIGICMPIICYLQMVFGVITAIGWCRDDHLGQCLAHFIMGSSFIAYGMVTILMLRLGSKWLRSKGKTQDYFDSWIIMVWGCINTWTEHRWNEAWTHKDYQHTALGIMWWIGGLVGIYLVRNGGRSVFPGLVIFFTGFAMSSHKQGLEISTIMHANFGYALMSAGLTRMIEVCWSAKNGESLRVFQQLPPYLLVLSGLLFMGANEEQLIYLNEAAVDPYSYTLIHVTIAFFIFLTTNLLIDLYWRSGKNKGEPKYDELPNRPLSLDTQTGRTIMNTNQDSPTSPNDYELNSLLVHNSRFVDVDDDDDDDDVNEK